LKVAKKSEKIRCKGGVNFMEVFEATTVLACFEKLKSRFKVIGIFTITLYISFVLKEKIIF